MFHWSLKGNVRFEEPESERPFRAINPPSRSSL
jgi:hypothetical protein